MAQVAKQEKVYTIDDTLSGQGACVPLSTEGIYIRYQMGKEQS